jgi:aspartyl-tRNA(Asn)/glutamyl-tRNA(Gln) amidotransferase subunit B
MTILYKNGFKAVIGLEIHAQVVSHSKLFSGAPSHVFGQAPNTCVSFVDVAFPGMLPVLNEACVHQAVALGLGVGGTINAQSIMERKHYMYPDNPSGYQISQYRTPLVSGGTMTIVDDQGEKKAVRLNRIHIEQDAGKSMHDQHDQMSCIDMNRAGVGLMEIVSEPDLNTPDEVIRYVKEFRCLMRHFGVCHGDMEKGNLRVDANISIHLPNTPLGTRVELKNMNSLRFLRAAIIYEIERQIHCLDTGKDIVQETRMFDINTGKTVSLRTKETATDYFYFPDPDLPPVIVTDDVVHAIKKHLPETPWAKKDRFMNDYGLSDYDATLLVEDHTIARFFDDAMQHTTETDAGKSLANCMIGDLFSALKEHAMTLNDCPIAPAHMGQLADSMARKELSNVLTKKVFALMFDTGKDPKTIMTEHNLVQVSDEGIVQTWINDVLAQNTDKVHDYFNGKDKLFGFFVGQVMKLSAGKGDPQAITHLLKSELDRRKKP